MRTAVFSILLVAPLPVVTSCAAEADRKAPGRTSPAVTAPASAPASQPRPDRPGRSRAEPAVPLPDEDFAQDAERAIDNSNYKRELADLEKALRQGE